MLPPRTGIGVYTHQLVRALAENHPELELILLLHSLRRPVPDESFLLRSNVHVRRVRLPGPWLLRSWKRFNLPVVEKFIGPVDVFHSPSGHIAPQRHGARVATVNDLHFLRHPEHCHPLGGGYLREIFPQSLPQMTRIIVPTTAVRDDVMRNYPVREDSIAVIPDGVDLERFHPRQDAAQWRHWREVLEIPERYILSVSTLEPRKNVGGLLEAYARLRMALPACPPLVLVGDEGWSNEGAQIAAMGLEPDKDVILTGYVSDEALPHVYRHCALFVLASHDEGFGLTVLEAMACGAPVVCTDVAALAEVSGEAALRTPAGNSAALAEAIKDVLLNAGRAAQMRDAGLQRVKRFGWDECARQTAEVYAEAAQEAQRQRI